MKIQVLADLHNEFEVRAITRTDADVVVLAGDTDIGAQGVEWAAQQFPGRPVVFVAGNHEFYGRELDITLRQIRAAAQGTSAQVLENDAFVVQGVRFLGCVLWIDFNLFGADASVQDLHGVPAERLLPRLASGLPGRVPATSRHEAASTVRVRPTWTCAVRQGAPGGFSADHDTQEG